MADFVRTMKDWRRMCEALGSVSCDGCKLHADGNDCVAVYEGEMDYAKAEKAITAWAKDNPAPIYPTWGTWLATKFGYDLAEIMHEPIPADIAEKLGIEPKEG